MSRRWLPAWLGLALLVVGVGLPTGAGATQRYVNKGHPTCGGQGPCYGTIQAAVTAAGAGDTITIQAAGTYVEQVVVQNKNNTSGASELDRIVIQAYSAAPVGAVVLASAAETCGGSG